MSANSIQIAVIKTNIINALKLLEWTPTGNAQPTKFQDVFNFVNMSDDVGSPFACVVDEQPRITNKSLKASFYGKETPIAVYVLSNFAKLKGSEAETRNIFAYEAVESYLCKAENMEAAGLPSYEYMGWVPVRNELNTIKGRILRIKTLSRVQIN